VGEHQANGAGIGRRNRVDFKERPKFAENEVNLLEIRRNDNFNGGL